MQRKVTTVPSPAGDITVSAIKGRHSNGVIYDEVCIFYHDDRTEVVGTYDDYKVVVDTLLSVYSKEVSA